MLLFLQKLIAGFIRLLFGDPNQRELKRVWPVVHKVTALEPRMHALTDEQLRAYTDEFKKRLADGESLESILPEAFAVVREVAIRTIKMRHYDVQILGGIILHEGKIAEMSTGEGKTLVATLSAYLNGLTGKGVHIVTVNDYLARRDRAWMGPVFEFLGLTVGCIQTDMSAEERQAQYGCDITYGTNNEFGFDYLRDNMKDSAKTQVQRSRCYAILDEVDNILVDEARTPLIISGSADESVEKYYLCNKVGKMLSPGVDFKVNEKDHTCGLNEKGIEKAERILGVGDLFSGTNIDMMHYIDNALRAHHLYQADRDYIVQEGQVVIVDEFTGRLMSGRRWSDGLHQAVEAKEGLKIKRENQTLATITFQNFFKLYGKIAGMTGTAATEALEFERIYKLSVVVIPTNKPCIRDDQADLIYGTAEEKWRAVTDDIVEKHKIGRPILVGTTSIAKSEMLSERLKRLGIKHEVLNAKYHEREAAIIAQAGQMSSVTIATNMAGRGTDIVLGQGVTAIGGLHVLGTERHEARRIDNQLRGRCGRQGDPGSSRFYLSLEDDLMRIFASEAVANLMKKIGLKNGQPIESRMVSRVIEMSQKKREEHNFDIRKWLTEYDTVMNEQRTLIYGQRQAILEERDIDTILWEMFEEVVENAVERYVNDDTKEYDYDGLVGWVTQKFNLEVNASLLKGKRPEDAYDIIIGWVKELLDRRRTDIGVSTFGVYSKYLMLLMLDGKWKDHLLAMDQLREAVGFRGYGQRDPLIEYKREGYQMFSEMVGAVKEEVTGRLFYIRTVDEEAQAKLRDRWSIDKAIHEEYSAVDNLGTNKGEGGKPVVRQVKHDGPQTGRNDLCPCGSGKKYKKCHGR
ncbi:MAG: preprotein translocase subunit SecA [Candidatus Brocadiia bacterium]